MVRKFIVDSVKFWASQYHLDGFRFDLMGLMDIQTISEVRAELNKIDPTILMIGEGWNMGTLPEDKRATQINILQIPGVAVFNDQIRDGIKGSVFDSADTGYATGKLSAINDVKAGIVGNVDFAHGIIPKWATATPGQSVNYVEAHDNLTLADKLSASSKNKTPSVLASIDRLSGSIAILAQGTPFMQAGQEFLRSKSGDSNSYQSGDAVNSLKWNLLKTNSATVSYYRGLLSLRKAHPAFRMATSSDVKKNLVFLAEPKSVIAYSLNGSAVKDPWSSIVVLHNPNTSPVLAKLPSSKKWSVVVNGTKAGTSVLSTVNGASVTVPALSTFVVEG
jgi:pullulanase/glycogen debranching enzyme